jgi:stress response protein SCP2
MIPGTESLQDLMEINNTEVNQVPVLIHYTLADLIREECGFCFASYSREESAWMTNAHAIPCHARRCDRQ